MATPQALRLRVGQALQLRLRQVRETPHGKSAPRLLNRNFVLAIACATGVLTGMINVLVLSIIQRQTPAEFRGRVLGLHGTMTRVLAPIGLVGGGVVADLTGRNVPLVYGVCGALALLSVTLLAARRNTREFLASS